MTNLTINTQDNLLQFIQSELIGGNNISIRGLARLVGVAHNAIIMSGNLKSQKLAQTFAEHGVESGNLEETGFNAKATWLVIEYYAYDAGRYIKPQAVQLARTFGQLGVIQTFDRLTQDAPKVSATPNELIAMLAQANVESEKRMAAMEATIASQNEQLEAVKDITDNFICPEGYETIRGFVDGLKDITVSAGFKKATMAIGNYLKSYDGIKHPNKVYDTKVGKEVNAYEIGAVEDAIKSMLTEGKLIAYKPSRGKIQIKTATEFNSMKGNYKEVFTANYMIDTYFSEDSEVVEVLVEQIKQPGYMPSVGDYKMGDPITAMLLEQE